MSLAGTSDQERLVKVLKRFCVSEKQIGKRFFETDREKIYQLNTHQLSGLGIDERHRYFQERAVDVMGEFYRDQLKPDHLVHVTCTGYLSPSAPQIYFNQMDQAPEITHAYHMGCYASLPAVRLGEALSFSRQQKVDIVHTEMCSLHLNPADHTPEQMVVQTLFADGHIKYSVSPKTLGRRFEIKQIKEKIIPDSANDMTWSPGPVSMR